MSLFRRKPDPAPRDLVRDYLGQLLDDGVAHIAGGISAEIVGEVLQSVKECLRRNAAIFGPHLDADGHYPRIINLHVLHRILLRLFAESPVALAVQDAFFGARSCLYTSLYYERGSAQPIHRDTPYFSTRPEYRYLGVWVALEDADDDNGCLQVVRKGHLIPEFDREAMALQHHATLDEVPPHSAILWDTYQSRVMEACVERGLEIERIHARAGDVIVWHPQLPHGGSPIGDISRTRHSFVMHVTPEGTPVYQQDVFFNPGKKASDKAPWRYAKFGGRNYANGKFVDIAGKERHALTDFIQ